jgi:uncharacterized membrane protein YphA (DoxX/SURF4 family)
MRVDGGLGRREGAKSSLLEDAREESSDTNERMARTQVGVDAGEGAESVGGDGLLLGTARNFVGLIAVLNRLLDEQLVLDNRPARAASELLLLMATGLKYVASLMMIFQFHPNLAALGLLGFTFLATLIFDNFWTKTGLERQMRYFAFLSNLSIMGGLLMVVAI